MLARVKQVAARVNVSVLSWKTQGRSSRSIGFQIRSVVVVDGLTTPCATCVHAKCECQSFG